MASNTKNYSFRKDAPEDFYDVGVVNDNLDKIDTALKSIEAEAKNKDGGNADTVDGYHASEFTKYREFNSLDELAEEQYEGLFYISASRITGISLKSGREADTMPDKVEYWDNYTRIYSNENKELYIQTDSYCDDISAWRGGTPKRFSFDGHSHSIKDIEDFPVSLPADGGNADTLEGKLASDFAMKNHSHNDLSAWDGDSESDAMWGVNISSSGIDFQWNDDINDGGLDISHSGLTGKGSFLPNISKFGDVSAERFSGNGSNLTNVNADTVDGKHASDLQNYNNLTNKPASLPANGGNAENAQFIKTYSDTNGYNTNNYGNFVHNGTSASDSWCVTDNNADSTFKVWYESGNVQAKGAMTAASFKGDGGGLTGVNATELSGRTINSIQTRDVGYCFYNRNKDWNDVTDVGYYGLMHSTSSALHNPVDGKFFYPMVFKYADDSITQIGIPHLAGHNDSRGLVYIRSKNNSYDGWSEWKSIGDGCNASSVNKKTVSFNASAGNWYRLVKGKPHDNSDNTGACGIMTIMADAYNYHSCDVITVAENKGIGSFTLHNHGNFNEFFGKYRMVKGIDGYMYIDAFINSYNSNIDDLSATLTFTFSGVGWEACGGINTANADYGVVVSEKEI